MNDRIFYYLNRRAATSHSSIFTNASLVFILSENLLHSVAFDSFSPFESRRICCFASELLNITEDIQFKYKINQNEKYYRKNLHTHNCVEKKILIGLISLFFDLE